MAPANIGNRLFPENRAKGEKGKKNRHRDARAVSRPSNNSWRFLLLTTRLALCPLVQINRGECGAGYDLEEVTMSDNVKIRCPRCQTVLRVRGWLTVGSQCNCPVCGETFLAELDSSTGCLFGVIYLCDSDYVTKKPPRKTNMYRPTVVSRSENRVRY